MPQVTEAKVGNKAGDIVQILGVDVSGSNHNRVLTLLKEKMGEKSFGKPFFVITANPEIIMMAQDDLEYRKILNLADLVIADGAGLRLAGAKYIIPGRKLARELIKNGKVFYLGGKNGAAQEMANRYGGMFNEGADDIKLEILNSKSETNSKILNQINKFKPDLLLVAYGAPWQEKWIATNLDKIKAKVVMGVGGTFNYLTGRAPEPPEWVSKMGCEWLWRLVHEPKRWKRQLKLVRFVGKVLSS